MAVRTGVAWVSIARQCQGPPADAGHRTVGARASVGHGQHAGAGVLQGEVLVRELHAVDALTAGAVASGEVWGTVVSVRHGNVQARPVSSGAPPPWHMKSLLWRQGRWAGVVQGCQAGSLAGRVVAPDTTPTRVEAHAHDTVEGAALEVQGLAGLADALFACRCGEGGVSESDSATTWPRTLSRRHARALQSPVGHHTAWAGHTPVHRARKFSAVWEGACGGVAVRQTTGVPLPRVTAIGAQLTLGTTSARSSISMRLRGESRVSDQAAGRASVGATQLGCTGPRQHAAQRAAVPCGLALMRGRTDKTQLCSVCARAGGAASRGEQHAQPQQGQTHPAGRPPIVMSKNTTGLGMMNGVGGGEGLAKSV